MLISFSLNSISKSRFCLPWYSAARRRKSVYNASGKRSLLAVSAAASASTCSRSLAASALRGVTPVRGRVLAPVNVQLGLHVLLHQLGLGQLELC